MAVSSLLAVSLRGATPAGAYSTVQSQVAANPSTAAAILKADLDALPPAERQRLAAGMLAAALKGLGKTTANQTRELFTVAATASPKSTVALIEVAIRAFPSDALALTEIAIKTVEAAGLANLIPAIVAEAVALVPDQRAALTRLALDLAPQSLASAILGAIAAALANPGVGGGLGALGGTINPANIGGSVVSPAQ